MSFSATWPQILAKQKTVTRRIGWWNLKVGEQFQAIQKGQGLKKGEKVVRGPILQCVSSVLVRLDTPMPASEWSREGFPNMHATEFVAMFCKLNNCPPTQTVNRIEFGYV